MLYKVYLATHKGKVREANEDNFVINKLYRENNNEPQALTGTSGEPSVLGVFDGMGGEVGGSVASGTAARVAVEFYKYMLQNKPNINKVINSYVINCNELIKEFMMKNKIKKCGSTFAMLYLDDGFVHAFSLGDTRIYLYSGGKLVRISEDHTLANKKYRANIYTREEAEKSPDSHVLTSYLGINDSYQSVSAEKYRPFRLDRGSKILICSDGMYDMCSDNQICEMLGSESNKAKELVLAALQNGGVDNVTCMLVEPKG